MKTLALVLAVVVASTACGNGQTVTVTAPDPAATAAPEARPVGELDALLAARDLWRAGAPIDYTVTETCDDCDDRTRTLAVRGDDVISLGATTDQATIDEVFEDIERAIGSGGAVEVTYDEALGYPRTVLIDIDADGDPEVDIGYADLEAMPIVQGLGELLDARRRWDVLGADTYRYIFRAACTCPDGGTFEVDVRDDVVRAARGMDAAAAQSTLSPGTIDEAFADLEAWFTDSSELRGEGFLEVDVRMDPVLGYPRWFRVVAEDIDDEAFAGRFEIVVTMDLVGAGPADDDPTVADDEDRAGLDQARARWSAVDLTDYRYEIVYHCECSIEHRGPFEITVRDGVFVSATSVEGFGDSAVPDVLLIDQTFELIESAITERTDIEVTYDASTGQPLDVIIDVDAVAVDGGLSFTMSRATPIE
ncbi:MAG: DUF6174 domain-containing protein [Acidimicrobiia bacterium]|nr:DUF6174 domain-containing protein [Acidimicrobiia bacterium]